MILESIQKEIQSLRDRSVRHDELGPLNDFIEIDNLKREILAFLESNVMDFEKYNGLISPIINQNFTNAVAGWLGHIKSNLDRIDKIVREGIHNFLG